MRRSALVLALVATLASACREPTPHRNLVLVSLDTVRRDRLTVYGYGRDTTSQLEELSRRAVRELEAWEDLGVGRVSDPVEVDEETREALRTFGHVQ